MIAPQQRRDHHCHATLIRLLSAALSPSPPPPFPRLLACRVAEYIRHQASQAGGGGGAQYIVVSHKPQVRVCGSSCGECEQVGIDLSCMMCTVSLCKV